MLTFNQFIYLFEAKLDEIITGIADRHKKETGEDIPPDELHDVVTKAKKIPGVDLTKSSYRELKDKVDPGIKQIYHDPKTGVTINHVTRKDACTKEYGHGKTNWCVAATGEGNLFDQYGEGGEKFFTVHHKNPDTGEVKIYGMHEHEIGMPYYPKGSIRDSGNEDTSINNVHPDVLKAMAKTKELFGINIVTGNPHFKPTSDDITDAMKHRDGNVARAALSNYPNKITPKHIDMAMKHPDGEIARDALQDHKDKITPEHIDMAMKHRDGEIARDALRYHPDKITPKHIDMAMEHRDGNVAIAALRYHPDKIEPKHIDMAMEHPDGDVARYALRNYLNKITPKHIDMAMEHPDGDVAIDALRYHPDKIEPKHIDMAMEHPDGYVARDALSNYPNKITPKHIDMAMEHRDGNVAIDALNYHKDKITPEHLAIAKQRGII